MDRDSLHDLLIRLHAELEAGPHVDTSTRELLASVVDDIRAALADVPEAPETAEAPVAAEHRSLAGRLKEAAVQLEESHPRLTSTVEEITNALASLFR